MLFIMVLNMCYLSAVFFISLAFIMLISRMVVLLVVMMMLLMRMMSRLRLIKKDILDLLIN